MSTHGEEVKARLGSLITEAYKNVGETRVSTSKAIGISSRSLYALEAGQATPRKYTQERLETFLGWKKGAIADLLSIGPGVDLDRVTLDTLRAEPSGEWVVASPVAVAVAVDVTAQRIQDDARALSDRLRERDRTIESLEAELKQERERSEKLRTDLYTAVEVLRAEQKRSEPVGSGR